MMVNTTQNITTEDPWPYVPIDPKQGLILFLITLPGTLANIVAFLATAKLIQQHKAAPNYLILALNLTDFYGIVFCTLPTHLCYLFKRWVGGDAMCNFQSVSTMFASLASGVLATAMATDRLIAIGKPFLYKKYVTRSKTFITIILAWGSSVLIAILPLAGEGFFVRNLTGTYCTINWFAERTGNQIYAVFYSIVGVLLISVVVFSNVKIVLYLIASKARRGELHGLARSVEESRSKSEMQLAKSVGAISVLFIICWFPFMIRIICNLTGVWVNAWVDVQVSRLLLINFVLDPFLYTLSRKQCRDIVKGWLCCCCSTGTGRRHSLFPNWLHGMRKKHGSFLSSSQTGSGHNINSTATTSSNIQLLHIKSSSANTTPDHSITDVVIHTSDVHDSETPPRSEISDQKKVIDETGQSLCNSKESNGDTRLGDEKGNHPRRLYSEVLQKEAVTSLEKTMSLPNLDGKQKEKGDEDMTVNIGYMYDLAFQRQTSVE